MSMPSNGGPGKVPRSAGSPRQGNPGKPRAPRNSSQRNSSPAARRKQLAKLVAGVIAVVLVLLVVLLVSRCGSSEPVSSTGKTNTAAPSKSSTAKTSAKPNSQSKGSTPANVPVNPSKLASVAASKLPAEAKQTLKLIDQGGPYPYDRDGINFGNFEGVLPKKAGGYYKEYTVKTPGESDRGSRRIIVGQGGEKYYTDDHYSSFKFIQEDQ